METSSSSSLTNTPTAPIIPAAPKKLRLAERRGRLDNIPRLVFPEDAQPKTDWKLLAESGYVRRKFLRWTPEDVAEIDDLDKLEELRTLYTPYSQPQNYLESAYLQLIVDAVNDRLYVL